MDRAEKREFVTSMNETLQGSGTVVVAHYTGLTVAQMNDYRSRMRNAGGFVKVAKNRLMKLALEGTDAEKISTLFEGQTLIAYSDDPVAAAKVSQDFAKTNPKLVLIGGAIGAQALDADGVKALAELPSLDELRAKIVGVINTPATRVAGVVQAPAGQLARVLQAYADKGEAA